MTQAQFTKEVDSYLAIHPAATAHEAIAHAAAVEAERAGK